MDPKHDIIQSEESSRESPLYPSSPASPDLHEILKQLPDIVFCVDKNAVVRYVNHTGFKIEISQAAGTLLYDLMPSNCNKPLKPALQQAFETGQLQQFDYLSGVNQWWHISVHPLKKDSEILHAIVIFHETTENKKIEQVMQFMELALTQASMEITITNPQGRIIYTNRESEEELVGQIPEILENDILDSTNQKTELWSTIERGEIWIESREVPDLFGDSHQYEISILPIQDTSGTITHYTIIQRDLTRIKTLETALHTQVEQLKETLDQKEKNAEVLNKVIEELTRARDEAAQYSRSSGELLAKMSHEIRTPLNSISSMIHLIMETALKPVQERYLNILKTSAGNLTVLMNDILDFGKIEAGQLTAEKEEFHLPGLLSEMMFTLAIQADEKHLELILDLQSDVPENVISDPNRIQQILTNLIVNSIKFTREGEVLLRVQNEPVEASRPQLRFSVIDTGTGIPKEMHESIFQPFIQDSSASVQQEGTGLGLTIAARLVEMLEGKIWIESPLQNPPEKGGAGCAIHMVLNLDVPEKVTAEPRESLHVSLENPSVLIVEDNATQRKVIEKILNRHGIHPVSVDSGRAALATLHQRLLQQTTIPLAIIDADLPNMDGLTLAEQILHDKELPESVIMMISPSRLKQDVERCDTLGIRHFLMKPVNAHDLIQQLNLIAADRIAPDIATEDTETAEESEYAEPVRKEMVDVRILLADDDEPTCQFIENYLSKLGWQITCVSNGKAALEQLGRETFDLILMDIKMPEMNGLEATAAIRESEKRENSPPLPIIAVTARAMNEDQRQYLEAGMTDYILKPVQAETLVGTIEKYLSGSLDSQYGTDSTTPINITKALNTYNGDGRTLLQQIDNFLASFMEKFVEFQNLLTDRRMKLLEEKAKDMKVKAGMIGANTIYRWADRLETMGWKSNLHDAPAVMEQLSGAYEELKSFVEQSDLRKTLQKGLMTHRILVIEDNLAYQEFLRKQLEAHGYEIILAKDGLEGLELARLEKPDLIILDLMLPQVNGHAVTHMLKLDRNCQHIPIMMLTCRNLEEDEELAHKGGANVFLLKSNPTEKILSEIKRLLDETPHDQSL